MRIIAGKYKSRNIYWPEDSVNIRPTKDRIREAIFSALGDIKDSVVLDLYAGSGSMGLEALSRDSKICYFVDNNVIANKTVEKNLTTLNVSKNQYENIFMDDFKALEYFKNKKIIFDLVFLDPPYAKGKYEEIISLLEEYKLLNDNSRIVLETDREISIDISLYKHVKKYKYSKIMVLILWK